MSEYSGKSKTKKAKVLVFNENLGIGILQILESKERVRFNYKNLKGIEGFKILFPGDIVEIRETGNNLEVRKISEGPIRID
ncbi:MAG: hypothetical protein ABIM21_04645 [candidate division WOR-3 bacterium]